MKKVFCLSYFILFQLNIFCQSSSNIWDLQKCIDTSLRNNISVRQALVQSKRSEIEYKQAKANLLPSASFSAPIGVQLGRSINPITNNFTLSSLDYQNYNINGSLVLMNWRKFIDIIRADYYSFQADLLSEEKNKNEIVLTVIQDYLQALLSKEQTKNAYIQLALTKKQLDIAAIRFSIGKLSGIDLAQLKSQFASDSMNAIIQEGNYMANILELKSLINTSLATPFEIDAINLKQALPVYSEINPELLYQTAMQTFPQVEINDLKVKAAELNLKVLKKGMYPSLSFNYNLASSFSNYINNQPFKNWWVMYGYQLKGNFYQQLSISLNVPLFNNYKLRNQFYTSKLDLQSIKLQQEQDNLQLKKNIFLIYSNTVFAFKKIEEGKLMVEESQNAYNLMLKGFEIGSKDVLSLITSENNLAKAKEQQISNQYDYIFKNEILRFYKNGGSLK